MIYIKRSCVVLTLLFVSALSVFCQETHSFVIVDTKDNLPIPAAQVLVMSGTTYDVSTLDGIVTFDETAIRGGFLVISHLSYGVKTIEVPLVEEIADTIFLTEEVVLLNEVTISTSKSNLKEKRLKRFKKDIFRKRFRQSKIENEEKILFSEIRDSLKATSSNLLEIKNSHLGYEILFLLEDYYRAGDAASYRGKAFFAEMNKAQGPSKRQKKRRRKLIEYSSEAFFRALLSDEFASKYKTFEPVSEGDFSETVEVDSLSRRVFVTTQKGIYGLVCPRSLVIKKDSKISILKSSSNLILFSATGEILNPSQVKVEGYWGELSLSETLPSEQKNTVTISDELRGRLPISISELRLVALEAAGNIDEVLIEELIVRTDRLLYGTEDVVLVDLWLRDFRSGQLLLEKELVYLELVGFDDEKIILKSLLCEGGRGSIGVKIPKDLVPGQYYIRAYTNYMKNFDQKLFGTSVIGVDMLKTEVEELKAFDHQLSVAIYPEGGHLIIGEQNRVVFTCHDDLGRDLSVQAKLRDTVYQVEYELKTIVDGLGVTYITPNEDSKFVVVVNDSLIVALSNNVVISVFPVLSVGTRGVEDFDISILGDEVLDSLMISISIKGNDIFNITNAQSQKVYKVNKNFLPVGLLTFTLHDEHKNVLSKRIVNNATGLKQWCDFKFPYSFLRPNEKYEVSIQADTLTDLYVEDLNWKLKVVHEDYDRDNIYRSPEINLVSGFVPSFELGEISQGYIYNLSLIAATPNEMYHEILTTDSTSFKYLRTSEQEIRGYVMADNESKDDIRISISSLDKDFFYKEVTVDKGGSFVIPGIPYREGGMFFLQARILNKGKDMSQGDRDVDVFIDSLKYEFVGLTSRPDSLFSLRNMDPIEMADYNSRNNILSLELDEFVVKSKDSRISRNSGMLDITEFENIPPRSNVRLISQKLFPRALIGNDWNNSSQLTVRGQNEFGALVRIPLIVLVNGERQYDMSRVDALEADQIRYIGLSYDLLSIITNPNFSRRSNERELAKGSLVYAFEENVKDAFFVPKFISDIVGQIDNRKTLYYNSNISFKDGFFDFGFVTSDIAGFYNVEISTVHPSLGYISLSSKIEVK